MAGRCLSAIIDPIESILSWLIADIVPFSQLEEKAEASVMADWDFVLSIISVISVEKFFPDNKENAKMLYNSLDIKTGLDLLFIPL